LIDFNYFTLNQQDPKNSMTIPTSRTTESPEIKINTELCNGCGLCVSVCSDTSLIIENKSVKRSSNSVFDCIGCGLEWRKIESLFIALGATVIEGNGSRVSFVLNNEKGDFHRPHPSKEAKRYQVRNALVF
jgi:Pyruvate/2-oxoacid:ferredoxin oxidoreductase delta subunit